MRMLSLLSAASVAFIATLGAANAQATNVDRQGGMAPTIGNTYDSMSRPTMGYDSRAMGYDSRAMGYDSRAMGYDSRGYDSRGSNAIMYDTNDRNRARAQRSNRNQRSMW